MSPIQIAPLLAWLFGTQSCIPFSVYRRPTTFCLIGEYVSCLSTWTNQLHVSIQSVQVQQMLDNFVAKISRSILLHDMTQLPRSFGMAKGFQSRNDLHPMLELGTSRTSHDRIEVEGTLWSIKDFVGEPRQLRGVIVSTADLERRYGGSFQVRSKRSSAHHHAGKGSHQTSSLANLGIRLPHRACAEFQGSYKLQPSMPR